jgi:threonine synthase
MKQVFDRTGYVLDPHSAIGYLGLTRREGQERREGIFLATAHPAKFSEIVEPVIGKAIDRPAPLTQALARPRQVMHLDGTLAAVRGAVGG